MTSLIDNISIDCSDAFALAGFWSQVLGMPVDPECAPGDEETGIDLGGRWLLFLQVPEPKTVKNRMHLCLSPQDVTRDAEVERLLAAGASMVDDRRSPDRGWAVLADPEGNEFCILRSRSEREAE